MHRPIIVIVAVLVSVSAYSQPTPDTSFNPPIAKPAYKKGNGPVVMIDEAHFNWHTVTGRYSPFGELLRRDGYVVRAYTSVLSKEALNRGNILVIANAVNERNKTNWVPPFPSAFGEDEIKAVHEWVNAGGSLLLIADHLPWPAAADKLASAFGVHYSAGHAVHEQTFVEPMIFKRSDGSLADHAITKGRSDRERVISVATFTGSAFRVEKSAKPLLIFGPSVVSFTPSDSWMFKTNTARIPVTGWTQGAVLRVGKGRAAFFGEAAMFSAQVEGPNREPFGMNAPGAEQNPQFILNLLHWLSGLLDG